MDGKGPKIGQIGKSCTVTETTFSHAMEGDIYPSIYFTLIAREMGRLVDGWMDSWIHGWTD